MYVKTDPRSKMAAGTATTPTRFGPSYYGKFYEQEPQELNANSRSWYIRSQNAILSYSVVRDGAEFVREGQPDEFAFLLHDHSMSASVEAGGVSRIVKGSSLSFVPPGESRIRIAGAGQVVRVFTVRSEDLLRLCSNAAGYQDDPNAAPLVEWPAPPDGFKLRSYDLDVSPAEGRFGRIFRSTNIMMNLFYPRIGRRDPRELSPHHHDDFQQFSLALEGSFQHHLRWPWASDKRKWLDDEHEYCGAPSACVIPAAVIHTSEPLSQARNMLIDIFCPPRMDFSIQPGWVLNADDYPAPDGIDPVDG